MFYYIDGERYNVLHTAVCEIVYAENVVRRLPVTVSEL